jgi:NAD(P)-dependent dehydrogenase (short-subunit alcohol dehydrogenase family)
VAIITGAGRGIGRATAEAFAAEGYTLVLAELLPALGRRVEQSLLKKGVKALFVETDAAEPKSLAQAVTVTLHHFGRIDCLVNNAGVLRTGALVTLAVRDLDRMLAVNLRGPLLFARAVLPVMLHQRSGSIINVASLLGKQGAADYVTYCASKFGVVGFTEALGEELTGTRVRAFAVCPGMVDTLMVGPGDVPARERKHLLRPEAVARMILDLATGRRREPNGAAVEVTA